MSSDWAAQHLQTIRTLMERSAVYRRALAPLMTFSGIAGIAAAAAGIFWELYTPRVFAIYWMSVSLAVIVGNFLLVRKQSIKDHEPFWSPPTRRVAQALLPALFVGFGTGVIFILAEPDADLCVLLAVLWMALYGCAVHAAGFFMPRGMKLFAWGFILLAVAFIVLLALFVDDVPDCLAHATMGVSFGLLQLAYGVYLYFTEPGKNAT